MFLLPAGPPPVNPSELLASARMKKLHEELKSRADFVLFDTPSAVAFSDGAILSSLLDATLMVVRSSNVPRGSEDQVRTLLAKAKANIIGVVLNGVPADRVDSVHYHYNYYPALTAGPDTNSGTGRQSARPHGGSSTADPLALPSSGGVPRITPTPTPGTNGTNEPALSDDSLTTSTAVDTTVSEMRDDSGGTAAVTNRPSDALYSPPPFAGGGGGTDAAVPVSRSVKWGLRQAPAADGNSCCLWRAWGLRWVDWCLRWAGAWRSNKRIKLKIFCPKGPLTVTALSAARAAA